MEDEFPGLWQRWLRCQCVTVGYPVEKGYKIERGNMKGEYDWISARNALQKIMPGDFIVAALPGRRIGRIGTVISNESAKDKWKPLIPAFPDYPGGQMGRRILVRWDLENGPDDMGLVAQLPLGFPTLGRGTLRRLWRISEKKIQDVLKDPNNWVGLLGRFGYEWALSDYIALYPHKLKDGLKPYPNVKKIREKIFKDCRVVFKRRIRCASKRRLFETLVRSIGKGEWIFRFGTGPGRACRAAVKRPSLPFARLRAALRLRPRRALSSAEATSEITH